VHEMVMNSKKRRYFRK